MRPTARRRAFEAAMERIGEYLVRRLVGEGGMGKVYEAEERLSRRKVALKVLHPELGRSEEARRMFQSEMTILAHLDHPNIVRCLSCSEVDGELVMALELLEGDTLRERLIECGRIPWPEAVEIAAQVAAALRVAHAQEPAIVHRDLKPENLMLLAEGRVKVMDFGIAKVLQAMRKSSTHSVGTLQYMSPEQIDAGTVDGRSDLYALGLILYEMLAGRAPFESASPRELLNLQCTAAPPALPEDVRAGLPKGIERLLLRLLAKAPPERPADAAEVLAALEPFSTAAGTGGESSAADPPAAVPVSRPVPEEEEPRPVTAAHSDTIALIERAARAREIPAAVAVVVVLALCALAGVATYVLRVGVL